MLLQSRQSANQDFGCPDEFALQVIDTSAAEMLVRIQRLDSNSGWGQDHPEQLDDLGFDTLQLTVKLLAMLSHG